MKRTPRVKKLHTHVVSIGNVDRTSLDVKIRMREQAATACMNMFVVKIGKLSKIFKIFVGDTYCALVLWKFCRLSDNQYRICVEDLHTMFYAI